MFRVDQLQPVLDRFKAITLGLMKSLVVWVANDRVPLSEAAGASTFNPIVVIGVEHYSEATRQFAVRSRRDINAVLRLEAPRDLTQLAYIGPLQNDQRGVRVFHLNRTSQLEASWSLFCVPESLVLSRALGDSEAFEVSRLGHRYFVTADGHCQRAGGLIQDAARFRLARGTPELEVIPLDEKTISKQLLLGLKRLSASDWLASISPELYRRLRAGWPPVVKLMASMLVVYFLVASVYLVAMSAYRQHQIDKLGKDVDRLLIAQRAVALSEREVNSITAALNDKKLGWTSWSLVKAVWDKGGRVFGLTINDEGVVLRGVVADATQLLSDVSSMPVYANAQFDAPVIQTPDGQQFVIAIRSAAGVKNAQ